MEQNIILDHDNEVQLQSISRELLNDEYLLIQKNQQYLERSGEGYPDIKTKDQYEKYLLCQYGDYETLSRKRFRIIYKGKGVGQIGLHSLMVRNFQPTGEIFYWIDEMHQGKGIVTRAVMRLLSYCFDILELDVVYLHCLISNKKSENVAVRCKFNYEGIAKYNGRNGYDEYKRYSKTPEQYQRDISSFDY